MLNQNDLSTMGITPTHLFTIDHALQSFACIGTAAWRKRVYATVGVSPRRYLLVWSIEIPFGRGFNLETREISESEVLRILRPNADSAKELAHA